VRQIFSSDEIIVTRHSDGKYSIDNTDLTVQISLYLQSDIATAIAKSILREEENDQNRMG